VPLTSVPFIKIDTRSDFHGTSRLSESKEESQEQDETGEPEAQTFHATDSHASFEASQTLFGIERDVGDTYFLYCPLGFEYTIRLSFEI